MKIINYLRRITFLGLLILACMMPVPLFYRRKDNLPKNLIERVDEENDEDEQINILQ